MTVPADFELRTLDRLVEARLERARLSLAVFDGESEAATQLQGVEEEITHLERDLQHAGLARDEQDRRDAERAEQAERDRQARAEKEHARLWAKRDAAVRDYQLTLAHLGREVRQILATDRELEQVARQTGKHHKPIGQTIAELAVITLTGAGCSADNDPLGYVRASVRATLHAAYPPPEESPSETAAESSSRCSICNHPARQALLAALAGGVSYRQLESAFSVSRSALSRHREHSS